MRQWEKSLPNLEKAIAKHFPGAGDEKIGNPALKMLNRIRIGAALSFVERTDFHPLDDIGRLKKAVSKIRGAEDALRGLGFHGGGALAEKVEIMPSHEGLGFTPTVSSKKAIDHVSCLLRGLADILQECAANIDRAAPSNGKPRGRPRKDDAYHTANEAYDVFERLSGTRPTIVTDPVTGKADGPFLRFLTDVFKALDIKASPEAFGREVCKEKKPENT